LPFTFRFFDGMYNGVVGTSNGWLGFGVGPGVSTVRGRCRQSWHRTRVLRVWGGSSHASRGRLLHDARTAPNRQFVWEINDEYRLADATNHLTIETFLNEGSNTIDVIYQNITGAGSSGENCNVGMQNTTATRSYVYEYLRLGSITTGLRVRFVPDLENPRQEQPMRRRLTSRDNLLSIIAGATMSLRVRLPAA